MNDLGEARVVYMKRAANDTPARPQGYEMLELIEQGLIRLRVEKRLPRLIEIGETALRNEKRERARRVQIQFPRDPLCRRAIFRHARPHQGDARIVNVELSIFEPRRN